MLNNPNCNRKVAGKKYFVDFYIVKLPGESSYPRGDAKFSDIPPNLKGLKGISISCYEEWACIEKVLVEDRGKL